MGTGSDMFFFFLVAHLAMAFSRQLTTCARSRRTTPMDGKWSGTRR